jgi:hypothetical protein
MQFPQQRRLAGKLRFERCEVRRAERGRADFLAQCPPPRAFIARLLDSGDSIKRAGI